MPASELELKAHAHIKIMYSNLVEVRPSHCGRHLAKINGPKSTYIKNMAMHLLMNYYVFNGKPLGKIV